MDDGEEAVLEIIKCARDNHKNRRAMQEELGFFEATYL